MPPSPSSMSVIHKTTHTPSSLFRSKMHENAWECMRMYVVDSYSGGGGGHWMLTYIRRVASGDTCPLSIRYVCHSYDDTHLLHYWEARCVWMYEIHENAWECMRMYENVCSRLVFMGRGEVIHCRLTYIIRVAWSSLQFYLHSMSGVSLTMVKIAFKN